MFLDYTSVCDCPPSARCKEGDQGLDQQGKNGEQGAVGGECWGTPGGNGCRKEGWMKRNLPWQPRIKSRKSGRCLGEFDASDRNRTLKKG